MTLNLKKILIMSICGSYTFLRYYINSALPSRQTRYTQHSVLKRRTCDDIRFYCYFDFRNMTKRQEAGTKYARTDAPYQLSAKTESVRSEMM